MTLTEDRPIFQQIAEQLEEAILSGAYPEESQVPSITELLELLERGMKEDGH